MSEVIDVEFRPIEQPWAAFTTSPPAPLDPRDQNLLVRLNSLPPWQLAAISRHWRQNPRKPKTASQVFRRQCAEMVVWLLPPAASVAILSPLWAQGTGWAVNLSIFALWGIMILGGLGMALLTLAIIFLPQNKSAKERAHLLDREPLSLLARPKSLAATRFNWSLWSVLVLALAVQGHFLTAMGLLAGILGTRFWRMSHATLYEESLTSVLRSVDDE